MPKRVHESRALRIAIAAAALLFLAFLFHSVGWSAIAANVARAGRWFPFLVAIYALAQAAFALGWWFVLEPGLPRPSFPRFFGIYLAGDTANIVFPGNLAGEPLKAHLLRDAPGTGPAVASLTIHKHADMLAQWIFVAAGVGIALWRFSLPLAVQIAAVATTAGLGAALLLLSWALPRGAYAPLLRLLGRWKFLRSRVESFLAPAERVDGRITEFYAVGRRAFALSTVACFAGWCGGLLETWIILRLLAPGAGWIHAFAIEALAMTINNLFLFVPGRVGTAEGVRVGIFVLLGLPAAQGAAYSVLRRGRELLWTLPGLGFLVSAPGRRNEMAGADAVAVEAREARR
ncbi:MAG TPA: lysylphosphatidylglycerol synthase domain-containing protein [Thermoanaerobaculia bacterium]